MKKSWFDVRLYREGLRQLRVMGILSLVLMTLAAVLVPVGRAIGAASSQAAYLARGEAFAPETLTFLNAHPLLILSFLVLAPVMSLYLFHFLDRRDACDFYHAIPQTRGCLYRSFAAALATWLLAVIFVSSLANVVTCQLLGRYLALTFSSVPVVLLNFTAASLLVAAAVLLATSLTGTLFTNMVVALLILFLPRAILLGVSVCLGSSMPYVSEAHLFPFLDYSWNVVVGTFVGWFDGNFLDVLYRWQSGVYTLVLALLYLVAAGVCFGRRGSEAAGQAALSRRLQLVFRLAVSLTICLLPIGMIYDCLTGGSSASGSWLFALLVMYLVAVIAYFLYELIATRKLRNLARAVPGLGVLAVLNLVLLFGMFGIYRYTSSQQPSPEEITGVSLQADGTYWLSSSTNQNGQEVQDYFDVLLEEVQLDSPEVRNMVSQRLRQTIAYYSGDGDQEANQLFGSANTWQRLLRIQVGGKVLYRNVLMTEADQQLLERELQQREEAQAIYQQLPESGQRETTVRTSYGLGNAAAEQIYETLRQEVAEMDFSQWYALAERHYTSEENTVVGYLSMSTYVDNQLLGTELPISTQMPETFRVYMEAKQASEEEALQTMLRALEDGSGLLVDLYCSGYEDGQFSFYGNQSFVFNPYEEPAEADLEEGSLPLSEAEAVEQAASGTEDEAAVREASRKTGEALCPLLQEKAAEPVEAGSPFLNFQITYFADGDYRNLDVYVAASREELAQAMGDLLVLQDT